MIWYKSMVIAHPIMMAIIQFAFLGTFGEIISKWIIKKKIFIPFSIFVILWKMVVWAILGVCIKYAFVGMMGFTDTLITKGYLSQIFAKGILKSFALSTFTNLQFGLFLVIFHRILDNLILKEKNWQNLGKGMFTLVWFWIPAHTLTFSLPEDFRIGLAAMWSVVLGALLGFFNRTK